MARLFRTRPQTVEAVQFDGRNGAEVLAFVPDAYAQFSVGVAKVIVGTEDGPLVLSAGDWLVREANGKLRRVRDTEHAALYEGLGA